MSWRYQPVWVDHKELGIREFAVCEVYLSEDGKLQQWTERHDIAPTGEDIDGLRSSIAMMMSDCFKWKAVDFDSLVSGMTFERL